MLRLTPVYVAAIIASILFLPNINAFAKAKQSALACNAYQRQHQNCLLKSNSSQVSVTKDKINFFDGVHREITDFPFKDQATEWVNIELLPLGNRLALQIQLWRDLKSDIGLQSQDWIVYELVLNKPTHKVVRLHEGVIQKRRKDLTDVKDKGAKDPVTKHSVELNKQGQILIKQDSMQKVF
jgi:hypothetical protein